MWIRSAYWEGRVKPGAQAQLRAVIDTEILAGLRSLPGVRGAMALWPERFEDRKADIICQVIVQFDDKAGMEEMLASPERRVLHGRLPELLGLIEGTVSHVNCDVTL